MLFNSIEYIFFFFPAIFILVKLISFFNFNFLSKVFLICASLYFYSFWNIKFLPLILISVLGNLFFIKILEKRKINLFLQILFNLFLLFAFKYTDFTINQVNFVFNKNIELLEMAFPLALSFFTFQQISSAVDIFQRGKKIKIVDYFLYVTFFPQLIAGPIVLLDHFEKQIKKIKKGLNFRNIYIGLFIFFLGLFKKNILADTFGNFVNKGFDNFETLSFLISWLVSLAWTLQFYFDFSGYTDMAIGSALILNIVLPLNFNSPLKSYSVIEFWKKWHISLGIFIQNYMYYPILKITKNLTFFKSLLALIVIMTLIGLWHGPNFTFIFFGFLHGVALAINYVFKKLNISLNKIVAWIITFNFINISFLVFRSENLSQFLEILKTMMGINKSSFYSLKIFSLSEVFFLTLFVLGGLIICLTQKNSNYFIVNKNKNPNVYLMGFIICISLIFLNSKEFLYFKF